MDEPQTTPPEQTARSGRRGGILRRFVYPLTVIAIIVGVIWYIEYRPDGATGPSGARYGAVDLPAGLVPDGANVAAEEGALAPDFLLERLDGGDLRLSDYRGQAVILNFWATWCAPCRKEMPQFVSAYDRYRDDGLEIIAVNMQEGKAIAGPFVEDFGIEFPVVLDRSGQMHDRYRLLGLPTTYFIDREGVIRSVYRGPFIEEGEGTDVQDAIGSSDLERSIAEIMAPAEDR